MSYRAGLYLGPMDGDTVDVNGPTYALNRLAPSSWSIAKGPSPLMAQVPEILEGRYVWDGKPARDGMYVFVWQGWR